MSEDDRQSDLRDLRRDLAESHAVATRTHHGLTSLATSLKQVVERQDKYTRGLSLNSFIAYLIFTVLLGGGFYWLYRQRIEQLAGAQLAADHARGEADLAAAAARREVTARDEGARKASELWTLAREGKRTELIARAPEVAAARLTPVEKQVLEEAVTRARSEVVDASFVAGMEAARLQQWKKAKTELRRALGFEPDGARSASARAQLGIALLKDGEPADAVPELDAALGAGGERGAAELRFYLASALEQAKQPERARTEYTKFADTKPLHPWAQLARRKANALARAAAQPQPQQ